MWYIHSLEYYWAVKVNEVLIMIQHGYPLKTQAKSKKP